MFSYYEKISMCKYLGLYYFNIIAENRYYDITQEEERSDTSVCRDLQAKYPRSPANDKKIIVLEKKETIDVSKNVYSGILNL